MMNRLVFSRTTKFFFLVALLSGCSTESNKQGSLFAELTSERTNIHFANLITEDPTANAFVYEYIYNGGGVAVGDINNDGLEDIYFIPSDRKWYLDEEIGMEEGEEAKILIFKEGTILAYDFKDEDFYNNLSTTKLRINEIDIYAAIPVEWVLKHKKAFRRL